MERSFRSTLSLTPALAAKLKRIAAAAHLSPIEAVRVAVEQYVSLQDPRASTSRSTAAQLRELYSRPLEFDNPFQDLIAAWRLERTNGQFATILAPRPRLTLQVSPSDIYLLQILTELLENLGANDELLVVTHLSFWYDAEYSQHSSFFGYDCAQDYLQAQKNAITRGMRLWRVFLLTDEDLEMKKTDEHKPGEKYGLQQHKDFLAEVTEALKRKDPQSDVDRLVRVTYRRVPSLDEGLLRLGHFACIRRLPSGSDAGLASDLDDTGSLIVEPEYYAPGKIRRLRFLFSSGPVRTDPETKQYFERFLLAASDPKSIASLPGPEPTLANTTAAQLVRG